MEMVFVMGKRTRSRCQATALQRPCQWLRTPLQRQSYGRSGQPGAAGGPHHPTEPGLPRLLPQGPPQRRSGEMGLCPLACPPEGPCPWGSPMPAAPKDSSCPAPSSGFSQAAQRDVPLQCRPGGEAALCKVVLWGLRGCLQSPSPSLSIHLQVLGGFHSPILQPALCSCPFTPLHPVAQPRCRAGTTWVVPLLPKFSL